MSSIYMMISSLLSRWENRRMVPLSPSITGVWFDPHEGALYAIDKTTGQEIRLTYSKKDI